MKKSILNVGKSLNKAEQKTVLGGGGRGGCQDGYYFCDGTYVWVGPCHWPHIPPC